MKRVECSNSPYCEQRRIHFEQPDTPRGKQYIEVEDDYEKPAYCSLTCAIEHGAIRIRKE